MTKRKEIPVKHYPGIYKLLKLDTNSDDPKWVETGRYRAIRRIKGPNGYSRKEQQMFDNWETAKAFRYGGADAGQEIKPVTESKPRMTFEELVKEWQPFHYLKLERSTQQTYTKRLPGLDFLMSYAVEDINVSVVDSLIQFWVRELPKRKNRENFEKELNLLKVILNHYRKRKNPSYVIPVFQEHYQAADIAKKADPGVQSLSAEELKKFLEALKASKQSHYYPVALTQFCLGLRIGEVCGLHWLAIDLPNRVIRIEWTIEWDHLTWEPRVKHRPKNGKIRTLVIPEVLAEELERLKAVRNLSVPFVFHKKGKPLNRQLVGKAYNLTLVKLGIHHVRGTHMLRKTAATLANEITGDFYAVSKLLDHQNPNVTLRYVSQTGVQKQKVAKALDSALDGLFGRSDSTKTESENVPSVPQIPAREIRPRLTLVYSK
jgi:integrase